MNYKREEKALYLTAENGMRMKLEILRDDILHCICSREEIDENLRSSDIVEAGLLPACFPEAAEIPERMESSARPGQVRFATSAIRVSVDLSEGRMTFAEAESGRLLLQEGPKSLTKIDVYQYTTGGETPVIDRVRTVDGERNFIRNLKKVKDHEAYRAKYGFVFSQEEGIYGFGQGEDGVFDHRHQDDYLYQHNMRIPMPMFYSDAGYGMLFDCGSLMTFEDDVHGSYLFMDAVPYLDYYFIAGSRPDDVIDGFRTLTGRAAMLPKWAFGYIQSKEQYYSAAELAETVEHYRALQIPIDGIVQDWNSWKPGNWGEKKLDPARYADTEQQLEKVKNMHAHAMISVWPNMNSTTDDYREMLDADCLLNDLATYDAFDEKARKLYWEQAEKGLFDRGFEAWWCDSTEPFSGPDWNGETKREPWERYALVGEEHKKYLPQEKTNLYALEHAKGIYENQRKTTEEIRVLNLTRSGYASGQKYAALLWSGDISAGWDTMRRQLAEGLSMGLSGYPYWTLDIGGFFVLKENWQKRGCGCNTDASPKWFWNGSFENGVRDYAYREFYVRFLELGCFLPVFRSHGTDTPREIWNFGKEGEPFYDAIAKFIRLRYALMPYIYSLAAGVVRSNATMMRSLLFDFGDDRWARRIADEFMLGSSLLVCPVLRPMYYEPSPADNQAAGPFRKEIRNPVRTRPCYLPAGAQWVDFWTGERYQGGQTVMADTPLDRIPLYVRAGSILPMKSGMQYASDAEDAPLEIHVYSGADAHFTLYEDEGNSYRFEKGEYALTEIDWDDMREKLTVSERQGRYRGMCENREIRCYVDGEQLY
jgi:alpha-D-xyloside xylohydrolase